MQSVPSHLHPHHHVPTLQVSPEALTVDDRRYPLTGVDEVWLQEKDEWVLPVVGFVAGNGLFLLGSILILATAPAFFWLAAFAGGTALCAAALYAMWKSTTCYEIVLRRGAQREIVVHSDAAEPVRRAFDELERVRQSRSQA